MVSSAATNSGELNLAAMIIFVLVEFHCFISFCTGVVINCKFTNYELIEYMAAIESVFNAYLAFRRK